MKCPRCHAALTAAPDEAGIIVCAGCGARLRRPPAAPVPLSAAVAAPPAAAKPAGGEIDSILARLEVPASPAATLPPGTPRKPIPRSVAVEPEATIEKTLETLVSEVRALRRIQDEILRLVKAPPTEPPAPQPDHDFIEEAAGSVEEDPLPMERPPLRSRRRKSVLVIDDDELALKMVVEAMEHAEVPVRVAHDGSAGLAAIAQEKPDIVILELDLGGVMTGKDVINMIKATMEWVDIPIILHTRAPVTSQKEARTIHGADEFVPKDSPLAAETLVSQVITLFRKA